MTERTPGPWTVDDHALGIWAPNAKIGGETKIFDVRGWGYLTGHGHGALALDTAEAKAIQTANARLAAAALDMMETLQVVAKYLGERGQSDNEAWGLFSRCIFTLTKALPKESN